MSPSSRIPPLLQPYTRLPKNDSILLLTSTLGASANWLIIRFLCEVLSHDPTSKNLEEVGRPKEGKDDVSVILVSWMRSWEFWKSEARKGGSLDLERLKRDKKLAFVDGLSQLFLPETPQNAAADRAPHQTIGSPIGRSPQNVLPVRGPPGKVPARTPATTSTLVATASVAPSPQLNTPAGHFFTISPDLKEFERAVESAIRHLQSVSSKTLLILDIPSLLLATNPSITPSLLSASILRLHTLTSHILVHLPADDALLSLSTPPQPLEVDGHNFLVKTAHMSSRILSCRVLDTGVARDISGVLRVTKNPPAMTIALRQDGTTNGEEKQGRELLYLVKGDGSVKIFERGAGGES